MSVSSLRKVQRSLSLIAILYKKEFVGRRLWKKLEKSNFGTFCACSRKLKCFFFQQSCSLIQKGNHLGMTTTLRLKLNSSNTKLQINFSCLLSRYYIWKCKLRDEIPNLPQFLRLLKKTYEIETNELNLQPEKWKSLLGHL